MKHVKQATDEDAKNIAGHVLSKNRKRGWGKGVISWGARILLGATGIAGFLMTILPWGRGLARAILVLPALVTAAEPGLLVANGGSVRHTEMVVQAKDGPVYLDIYAPASKDPLIGQARNGILIVAGVGDNRKFGQLVNLATSLARSGAVVMNMTTPTLIDYEITAEDSDATVKAFQTLQKWPGMEGRRIGMVSFSAGVALTSLAAADPRIRDQVAFITAFGGYFDAKKVVYAFGQREITVDGKREKWNPIDVPLFVLANMTTKEFTFEEQKLIKNAVMPKGEALSAEELARMSKGAQAVYHLLKGDQPKQVDENMRAVPLSVLETLEAISPRSVVGQIKAPIYLLHDRSDASLPVTESRDFVTILEQKKHTHNYVEFHIFDHVQVRSQLDIWEIIEDGSQLLRVLADILQ